MELTIEHRLTSVEDRAKSNTHRLEKLEESHEAINKLALSMERMALNQDVMNKKMDNLTTDVETLKAEPGKRWKFVVEKAIYFVVGALLTWLFSKVGL